MMSRLSRRSVFDALLTCGLIGDSATTWAPWWSGGPEDVDHEVQRVGALDAGGRLALGAVAVLRRDRDHDAAADLLAHQGLVPALDDAAHPDRERREVTAEVLIEGLLAAVHLAEVPHHDRLTLGHRGPRAGVEHGHLGLAVGLRRALEVESGDDALGGDDLRGPRGRGLRRTVRLVQRLGDQVED